MWQPCGMCYIYICDISQRNSNTHISDTLYAARSMQGILCCVIYRNCCNIMIESSSFIFLPLMSILEKHYHFPMSAVIHSLFTFSEMGAKMHDHIYAPQLS